MPIKVVVFGAEGLLGTSIIRLSDAATDIGSVGLDREACDITDIERIREICKILRPQVFLNCASFTDVDGAEGCADLAMAVNATGAGNVATVANEHGALALQLSTDYIFDGESDVPYREVDTPNPLSVYGRSKLAGEEAVRAATRKHLIVRTTGLYGYGGPHFVAAILRKAEAGEDLTVVDDQVCSPTCTTDLAVAILELIRQRRTGTVHAVNSGAVNWCTFARRILELAGLDVQVTPIDSAGAGRAAPRPAFSVLSTEKLSKWLDGGMAPWDSALCNFLQGEDFEEE